MSGSTGHSRLACSYYYRRRVCYEVANLDEAESIIAALLAAVAAGTISDVKTARAWTGAEFKAVAERASKAASHYRAPGKS